MKSDAGKSVLKIKEQIKNEKELNLVQLNLERLHKLDKTSCVNNIASNLVCIFALDIFVNTFYLSLTETILYIAYTLIYGLIRGNVAYTLNLRSTILYTS